MILNHDLIIGGGGNVPLCPVLSRFQNVPFQKMGEHRDKTGQSGTKRDKTGHFWDIFLLIFPNTITA